jgi:Zn-dependent protease
MGFNFDNFNVQHFIITMGVLILAITIHEFAHAITADRLGDPTPRSQGRISLFPTDHLDPIGTIMMVLSTISGFGIGWGKPVQTNPRNFRNPRRDSGIVAIAGPISNILQAIVFSLLIRASHGLAGDSPIGTFFILGLSINLSLAFFNMLPIGPLDGHWVVQWLLPREQANRYEVWNQAYGGFIFLGCVLMAPGVIGAIIGPAVFTCAKLLLTGA